jgi:hypothetical protein
MDLKGIGWDSVDWTRLSQGSGDKWQGLWKVVMKLEMWGIC